MLESLYEKTIEKREEIQQHFQQLQEKINYAKVKDEYRECTFNRQKQTKTFIATDGSLNSKRFMSDFLYAIGSLTILSKPGENIIKDTQTAEIELLSATKAASLNRKLSKQMNILELKSMIKCMQNHDDKIDYILLDGNISGKLSNFQINLDIDRLFRDAIKEDIQRLEEELDDNSFEIEVTSNTHQSRIYDITRNNIPADEDFETYKYDILDYYDSLEELACIRHLINKYHGKIICISKTSSTNKIFNEDIPDAAVIEYATKKAGYTKIGKPVKNRKLVRKDLQDNYISIEYPLYREEITNYEYITFFTRLEYNKNVLKIEIPLLETDYISNNNEIIMEILEDIYSISVDGYPHILKKVHHEVVIKNKELDKIVNKYEILDKNGRDML